MSKGRVYHDPPFRYHDSYSGREVMRLTHYLGHSNHLYFTDPCWFNGGRSMVFTSDRENQSNLFRCDRDAGVITQLTDLKGAGRPGGCFSAANHRHYFWWQNVLYELDVDTFEERAIAEAPPPLSARGQGNCLPAADGKYICSLLMEVPEPEKPGISFAYSRFREFFLARPRTQIVRIEVATGRKEVIHEDRCYMGHVNTSPTRADVLTFCHEGPWNEVDQRIWGLNILTGEVWKIRPQGGDVAIGHEYWFADGERIGYHGRPKAGQGRHIFGHVRWDNSDPVEVSFPFHSTHFHSLDETLIVGDGTPAFKDNAKPFIQLFQWDGERYVGPRILAYHRSTFNDQHAHCHPRFTPDGRHILYASDLTAYSNMYLAEIGNFDDLPELT
jgi:oligogalacturonide lyase